MLIGNLEYPETYQALLAHPIWQQALAWLKNDTENKPDGEYEINGRDMYASISTIDTLPIEQGVFEAHKQYIDIHYCINGGEVIGWIPVQELTNIKETNHEKDYTLFAPPPQYNRIHITPGTIAVFMPADAHMPKLSDGSNNQVRKVVVKIRVF